MQSALSAEAIAGMSGNADLNIQNAYGGKTWCLERITDILESPHPPGIGSDNYLQKEKLEPGREGEREIEKKGNNIIFYVRTITAG